MLFVDNFKRNGAVNREWADESSSWILFNDGTLDYVEAPATGAYQSNQLVRPFFENFLDGLIQVDYVPSPFKTRFPQLHGRIQGVNDDDFYIVYRTTTDLVIARNYVGGTLITIATTAIASDTAGSPYRMQLRMVGGTISASIWSLTGGVVTLLGSASGVDGTPLGTGKHGIGIGGSGTASEIVRYRNYVAVDDAGAIPYNLALPPVRLFDRFEGTLANWTVSGGVAIAVRNDDEKMVLNDTGAGIETATQTFIEPTVPYIVEADLQCASSQQGVLQLLDTSNNVIGSLAINTPSGGQAEFDTDNTTATSFTWAASEYKQVRVLVDPIGNTMRCQYSTGNGTKPSSWTWVSAAKTYTGTTITQLHFVTNAAATGEMVVDEARVYIPMFGAIGDSNTAGHDPTTTSPRWNPNPTASERTTTGEDENHSWPRQFSNNFQNKTFDTEADYNWWCINNGVNADQADDADVAIQNLLDLGIRHVVVMIGTNDIYNGVRTLVQMQSSMNSIIGKINAAGISATICDVPPSNLFNATQNTLKSDFNTWLMSTAVANNFYKAEIHNAVQGATDSISPSYDAGDGLHFNTVGLIKISDTILNSTLGVATLGGVVADKNGDVIDASVYNIKIIVADPVSKGTLTTLTTTDAGGVWSVNTGIGSGVKYITSFFFEGAHPSGSDIAGSDLLSGQFGTTSTNKNILRPAEGAGDERLYPASYLSGKTRLLDGILLNGLLG